MRDRSSRRPRPKLSQKQVDEVTQFREKKIQNKKEEPKRLSEHLQAFNDAVIAIVMTIIVLEIKPPLHEAHYHEFLSDIFIFLIAFFILADFWYDLHKMFSPIIFKPNKAVVIMDVFLLADLALLPVMTKWIMGEDTGFAVMNFGIVFFIAQILKILIQYFGSKDIMKNSKIARMFLTRGTMWKGIFILVLNILLIGLAFYLPRVAMVLYIIIPIISFFFTPEDQRLI